MTVVKTCLSSAAWIALTALGGTGAACDSASLLPLNRGDETCEIRTAAVHSEMIAIDPLRAYRFGCYVKPISGHGTYNLAIEWLDADRQHIRCDNSWMGILVGSDWQPHFAEAISEEHARYARLLFSTGAGTECLLRHGKITQLPIRGANLAVDLLASDDQVTVRVENRGDVKTTDLHVRLDVPPGLVTGQEIDFRSESLSFGQVFSRVVKLSGTPLDPNSLIRCTATARTDSREVRFEQSTRPFVTLASEIPAQTSELEPPALPTMPIKLGAYYFPVMLDWDRRGWGVRKVDYLTPKLGYYDETKPEVADWHIYWAVTHGISYFVFDYYENQGFCYLNDALDEGFLKSRFADRMEFCVDWCNEGHCTEFKPLDFSDKSLEGFIRRLCERYFVRKNYLRVDGKPVVMIHHPFRIANAHGGWEGCRKALDKMREVARSYGHPGVYFVAVHTNTPWLLEFAKGGFDCVTAYAYGFRDVPWGGEDRSLPFESLIPRHRECFATARQQAHQQKLDYIPTAWVGWDDAARSGDKAVRTAGNTPAAFRRMIEMLPEYVEQRTRLALFESWNEWGEGGQAEPGEHYGFGRLSAIRDVLTDARGAYTVRVPNREEVERLAAKLNYNQINDHYYDRCARSLGLEHGLKMDFESVHGLWLRPAGGLHDVRISGGLLHATGTSADPVFHGPPAMKLDAANVAVVRIRMSATAGSKAQLFWSTASESDWSESRSLTFDITADGRLHDYALEVAKHPEWKSAIMRLRFDPTDAPAEIAIDSFHACP